MSASDRLGRQSYKTLFDSTWTLIIHFPDLFYFFSITQIIARNCNVLGGFFKEFSLRAVLGSQQD